MDFLVDPISVDILEGFSIVGKLWSKCNKCGTYCATDCGTPPGAKCTTHETCDGAQ